MLPQPSSCDADGPACKFLASRMGPSDKTATSRAIRPTLVLALGLLAASPALAKRTFQRSTKVDRQVADEAISGAVELSVRAAAAVDDTDHCAAWFGPLGRAETVRANLKAIAVDMRADKVTVACLPAQDVDCQGGTCASITDHQPHLVQLCQGLFAMPSMDDARMGRGELGNGTREGTIVHQTSHFADTADPTDECHSRPACQRLARDVNRAVVNADSYQCLAEDVVPLSWAKGERRAWRLLPAEVTIEREAPVG